MELPAFEVATIIADDSPKLLDGFHSNPLYKTWRELQSNRICLVVLVIFWVFDGSYVVIQSLMHKEWCFFSSLSLVIFILQTFYIYFFPPTRWNW